MAELNESSARHIYSLNSEHGKQHLAECIRLEPICQDRNAKSFFRVDFLYNVLRFVVKRGFPWSHVCRVVEAVDSVVMETADQDIVSALRCFKSTSVTLFPILGKRNYTILRNFMLSTYFLHYNLYRYIFTKERELYWPQGSLKIEIPADPQCIEQAQTERRWTYDEAIKNIDHLENSETSTWTSNMEKLKEKGTENMDQFEAFTCDLHRESSSRERLEELIASLSRGLSDNLQETLSLSVNHLYNSVAYKLDKAAVPRPVELGPPDRYPIANAVVPKRNDKNDRKSLKSTSAKSKK